MNNERVDAFASRPRSLTELCGNIHFQGTIKQQLIQGLPEYLRTDAFVYHTAQRSCQQLSTDVGGKYRAAKNFMALASRVSPWGSSRKGQTSTGSQDLLVNHLNAPWEKDDTATHDTVTVLAAGYPGVPYGRSSALPL